MEFLKSFPLTRWAYHHPRVAGWLVLSLGMVILFAVEARDAGLLVTQWAALIIATVLVAGLCVWIISWEDNNQNESAASADETDPAVDTASTQEIA